MGKILLTGNGTTSQIIYNYKNSYMIQRFRELEPELYNTINNYFDVFRISEITDKQIKFCILDSLVKKSIPNPERAYNIYFEQYGLNQETKCKQITNIEALLKIAHLLKLDNAFYWKIEKTANLMYFNNGNIGINAIDDESISLNKFRDLLTSFQAIFTSNFDSLLDEIDQKEIYHLHGGFYYTQQRQSNGEMHIVKSKIHKIPQESFLIWGKGSEEKSKKSHGSFTFPMSFPINFDGYSILRDYYIKLQSINAEEVHIWGFSGLNDAHINSAIAKNNNIKKICKYCNPIGEANSSEYKKWVETVFPQKEIVLLNWDVIWDRIRN